VSKCNKPASLATVVVASLSMHPKHTLLRDVLIPGMLLSNRIGGIVASKSYIPNTAFGSTAGFGRSWWRQWS
jgi:hypothetical protein